MIQVYLYDECINIVSQKKKRHQNMYKLQLKIVLLDLRYQG